MDDTPRSSLRLPAVSSFVDKITGRVANSRPQGAASTPGTDDDILDRFSGSSIQCIRDKRTGAVQSMLTRVHTYGGGFAATKRQHILSGHEEDGKRSYARTNLTREGHSMVHKFLLRENDDRETDQRVTTGDNGTIPADYGDDGYEIDQTPTVAPANERIRRSRRTPQKQPKLSEQELLADNLAFYRQRVNLLSTASGPNPHIRVHHVCRKGRTLAFATAYLRSERGPKAIVSVLWQTKTRPQRAVCVTFSLSGSDILIAHCTCDHLAAQKKGNDENCYHAQVMFENQHFVDSVKLCIRRRQEVQNLEEGSNLFGECIDVERHGSNWHFLTAFLDRSLQNRKNLVRPWMFFMVLDVNMQIFVPIVKVYGKAVQCMVCRTSSLKRGTCSHEDGCLAACKHMQTSPGMISLLSDLGLYSRVEDSDAYTDVEDDVDSSEDERDNGSDEPEGNGNRSVRVPEVYYPTSIKRTILPCPGEVRYMTLLAETLDGIGPKQILSLDDRNKASCPSCGNLNTKPRYIGYRRQVKLYTVAQGTHQIYVYDWFCDVCREKRNFTGKACGVFPARKKSCYTTELMYLLLEMTCMLGISFRAAHKIARLFNRTPTASIHNQQKDEEPAGGGTKTLRRRANDAFRAFINHLDTSSPMVTNKLFSCNNCEVELSKIDCTELGISEEQGKGMKRLKAVVIDGTAAGILTKLPNFERDTSLLAPASGGLGSTTLVKVPKHRKLLVKLLEISRKCLRDWKKNRSSLSATLSNENLRFWLRNPKKLSLNGIESAKHLMTEAETQITQLYICADTCFCCSDNGASSTSGGAHTSRCGDLRAYFAENEDHSEVGGMLKQLFTITKHIPANPNSVPTEGNADVNGDPENQRETDDDCTESDTEDIVPPSRDGRRNPGFSATLLLPNVRMNAQFAESVISVVQFLLAEHIAMPYVGRISLSAPTPPHDNTPSPLSMTSFTSTAFTLHEEIVGAIGEYTSCIHFQEQGIPQQVPIECSCVKRMKQATVAINEASPVLGMFCQELLKLKRPLHITHSSVAASLVDLLNCHMEKAKGFFPKLEHQLTAESKEYYNNYGAANDSSFHARRINEETSGNDRRGERTEEPDGPATQPEGPETQQGRLELQPEGSTTQPEGSITQQDGSDTEQNGTATQQHGYQAQTEQYQKSQGDGSECTEEDLDAIAERERLTAKELQESKDSGICFPGRLASRPCIIFKHEGRHSCSKKYTVSRSHTPGLLTIQCACESPKLIGFIVMTQAESTALALSAVLTHLGIAPRTVYYDNACNLFVSTLIRVPWLLGRTRLAVDRFHYKSHKCCAYFDPDSYPQFDMERTETAESINARIGKNLNTIRYIKGDNLIPFLRTRFSLLNLVACFSEKYNRKDIEDENMTAFFHEIIKCDCESCNDLNNQAEEEKKDVKKHM